MRKKIILLIGLFSFCTLTSCDKDNSNNNKHEETDFISTLSTDESNSFYDYGYIESNGGICDFTQYYNTDSYVKVNSANQLLEALYNARIDYDNVFVSQIEHDFMVRNNVRKNETNWVRAITKGLYLKNPDGSYSKIPEDTPWDPNDTVYTSSMTYYEDSAYPDVEYSQTLNNDSKVHVIEITKNINLAYNNFSSEALREYGSIVEKWDSSKVDQMTRTKWYNDNPVTRLSIERTSNLLIYSKNGAKLTCGGFKLNYDKDICIRNLEFDEMWQWEDWSSKSDSKALGDYDTVGWAYFKIGYSENVLIDHCKFGKSFDGQIDVSNSYYESLGTYSCAPYGATGGSAVHISNCDFSSGSDDPEGYLYQMMERIEEDYQAGGGNFQYYKALRELGLSFEDILYGIAIPQKKGFLLGDSGTDVKYNQNLRVSFSYCKFTNLEDRIAKIRTGECVMYNCIVDSTEYIEYRAKLRAVGNYSANVNGLQKELQSKYNSSWKCGLVSQCIVCGNGGSFYAENVVYKGIENLLKNNDSEITNNTGLTYTTAGTYNLVNCSYQAAKDSIVYTINGEIPDEIKTINATQTTLTNDFIWRTEDLNKPFTMNTITLDKLEEFLNGRMGVGTNTIVLENWLSTNK